MYNGYAAVPCRLLRRAVIERICTLIVRVLLSLRCSISMPMLYRHQHHTYVICCFWCCVARVVTVFKGGELFLATAVVRMLFRNGVSSPFSGFRNGNASEFSADAAVPRHRSLQ